MNKHGVNVSDDDDAQGWGLLAAKYMHRAGAQDEHRTDEANAVTAARKAWRVALDATEAKNADLRTS